MRRARICIKFFHLLLYYFSGSLVFFTFAIPRFVVQLCWSSKKFKHEPLRNRVPIVCVGGFLAPKRIPGDTWGSLSDLEPDVLFPEIGGTLSYHDRACELFFALKGGRVDYGLEHSKQFGHDRFGETFPGLYPQWGPKHPVHLVGHSMGGFTARVLQHYLETGVFNEYVKTDASWIRSVTCISSPLNGSLATYALGSNQRDPPRVHWGSAGFALCVFAQVWSFLDFSLLNRIYDFGLAPWRFSRKYGLSAAMRSFKGTLFGRKGFLHNGDNAAYDMSIHSALAWNAKMKENPKIFYFSVANRSKDRGPHLLRWTSLKHVVKHVFFSYIWHKTFRFKYTRLNPYRGFSAQEWLSTGGDMMCTRYTQSHPRIPHESPHKQIERQGSKRFPPVQDLKPGIWHVVSYKQDHLGLVTIPGKQRKQNQFYGELLMTLRGLDEMLSANHK